VKFTGVVSWPLHTVWFATALTVAVGFTVMVKVIGGVVQVTPPNVMDAVTVIVPLIGPLVPLVAVKDGRLPVPDAPRPIAVLVLVQLYTVPAGGADEPLKLTGNVTIPLQ